MPEQNMRAFQQQFNLVYKQMDEVYQLLARHYGLSESALWILYIIRESAQPVTQSEVRNLLLSSIQTINSALKNLEAAGFVRLESRPGNKRNKFIVLTATGEDLVQSSVDHILRAEERALAGFTQEERTNFLRLYQKYSKQLRQQADILIQSTNTQDF